jgi:hypothetical protein
MMLDWLDAVEDHAPARHRRNQKDREDLAQSLPKLRKERFDERQAASYF